MKAHTTVMLYKEKKSTDEITNIIGDAHSIIYLEAMGQ
jgi:hypothetical protein